ncbi:hypothetical protein ACTXT7_017147 [Hymenolepis weldensis]
MIFLDSISAARPRSPLLGPNAKRYSAVEIGVDNHTFCRHVPLELWPFFSFHVRRPTWIISYVDLIA